MMHEKFTRNHNVICLPEFLLGRIIVICTVIPIWQHLDKLDSITAHFPQGVSPQNQGTSKEKILKCTPSQGTPSQGAPSQDVPSQGTPFQSTGIQ
ncbi:hypothetical protein F8M41_023103 [Gigaspora margarita]|uniref:Uncharacterized protein n=1 Tax=Gigaspora margarita TaxID=4874 RepID=A0A8H4ADX6_GIGMA|nr:hypothetical protein F8M41_019078 [Gigaspora margarita]KAF0484059.1 hypothetical protein F8M41_023103 [Gigaspora margarita]